MYAFEFIHSHNLLDIRWLGPFSPEAVARYAAELKAAFVHQGFQAGYRLRMDMRASAVQPRAALPAFAAHLGDFPRASRIAVVTSGAVARMQVRRIMTQPYLRIFDTADESFAWLTAA